MCKSKLGLIFAAAYLLFVMASIMLPFIGRSAELGMFPFTFTLPWSFLCAYLVNPFLSEAALKSEVVGVLTYIICGLINAAILYKFVAWLESFDKKPLENLGKMR